jgi:hypothetical protein
VQRAISSANIGLLSGAVKTKVSRIEGARTDPTKRSMRMTCASLPRDRALEMALGLARDDRPLPCVIIAAMEQS